MYTQQETALVEVLPDKISVEKSKPGVIQFKWGRGGHDLWDLSEEFKMYYDVNLTTQDEEMLCNLTVYTLWKGRYPTPKNKDNLLMRSDEFSSYLNNYDLIDKLYQKIKEAVVIKGEESK